MGLFPARLGVVVVPPGAPGRRLRASFYPVPSRRRDPRPLLPVADHIAEYELTAPPVLGAPVHRHLAGLEDLFRVRAVLDQAGELEELPQPDRRIGDARLALIVPFLVAGASLVLLREPRERDVGPPRGRTGRIATTTGVFLVGVYSGYFGAAAGVVMLALLARALADSLIRVNAVKNVLLGASNAVAAIGFVVLGDVSWSAALPLTAGLLVGNYVGPAIARRLPSRVLRVGIALAGLILAAVLLHRALTGG